MLLSLLLPAAPVSRHFDAGLVLVADLAHAPRSRSGSMGCAPAWLRHEFFLLHRQISLRQIFVLTGKFWSIFSRILGSSLGVSHVSSAEMRTLTSHQLKQQDYSVNSRKGEQLASHWKGIKIHAAPKKVKNCLGDTAVTFRPPH